MTERHVSEFGEMRFDGITAVAVHVYQCTHSGVDERGVAFDHFVIRTELHLRKLGQPDVVIPLDDYLNHGELPVPRFECA